MTITIHVGSLLAGMLFGVIAGAIISAIAVMRTIYDDRWSAGFGEGWEAKRREEERNDEARSGGVSD